jgi:tRNA-binding EMAP/Myf-like protein
VDGEEVEVKEAKVGGCTSQGMLCDAPMLGWTGGGAGNAALVPESFEPGDAPPERRPRMDGKADGEHRRRCRSLRAVCTVAVTLPCRTGMAG